MDRLSLALFVLLITLQSNPVQAEYVFRPFVDAAISIPTGDWTDTATVGLGALAGIEVGVKHLFLSTVRIGWIQGLPKKNTALGVEIKSSASHLPKFLGVLWFPAYKILPAFVVLEAGYSWNVNTIHEATVTSGMHLESKDTYDKCVTIGLGYRHDVFDARLQIFLPDAVYPDEYLSVMLTAGYRFWN